MILKTKTIAFIILLVVSTTFDLFAQSYKKFYSEASELFTIGDYEGAIKAASTSINIYKNYVDAYELRAKAYEKTNQPKNALKDYLFATELDKKESSNFYNAGRLSYLFEDHYQAIKLLNECIELDKKNLEAYEIKIRSLIAIENYDGALYESNIALKIKKTPINYFLHGYASFYLKDFETAEEDLVKATKLDIELEEAYYVLAQMYEELNQQDKTIVMCNMAILLNPNRKASYLIRSRMYYKRYNIQSAITDLSQVLINIDPKDTSILATRASYFVELKQYQNAILDYTSIINLFPETPLAYYYMASCYELLNNKDLSITNYQSFLKLSEKLTQYSKQVINAESRIYELNKEFDKPEITLLFPKPKNELIIEIPDNIDSISISGLITDKSKLKYLQINKKPYTFSSEFGKRNYNLSLNLKDVSEIIIEAEDIYNNYNLIQYQVIRTETKPPKIHLISPYATDNGEIILSSDDAVVYIEGKVTDQSLISSIMIDDVYASYSSTEVNPVFSANVKIGDKTKIQITVKDGYGNVTAVTYQINKANAVALSENPMGKTWVVFIQNSNYTLLPTLQGPANDVILIKSALSNYNIQNFLHKKDMNKEEMQKFFSIELRDLVKENNVNSLLIWYAGHGKYMHETGYWMPINANPVDEFTFFEVNYLKVVLQNYSKYLEHILVITDACESGPSFYMAMRSEPTTRDCNDWTSSRFKSAQVLTSTAFESAADQSKFASTFANSLTLNPNDCISVDEIVIKISKVLKDEGKQLPQFGKIAGLEDEDGSFFFKRLSAIKTE